MNVCVYIPINIWVGCQGDVCNTTDISVSPCNNRTDLPSPLLRQRVWVCGSQQDFERTPFTPKPQHFNKYYSTFPEY